MDSNFNIKEKQITTNNKKVAESKLKHVSNVELLEEIRNRYKKKIVNRRDLLQLAEIDWCLECGSNGGFGERKIDKNGYCWSCNNNEVIIKSEQNGK